MVKFVSKQDQKTHCVPPDEDGISSSWRKKTSSPFKVLSRINLHGTSVDTGWGQVDGTTRSRWIIAAASTSSVA